MSALFIQAEESTSPTVTFDCVISNDSKVLEVTIILSNCPKVKAIGIKPIYDSEKLEYVSGEWLIESALISDWGEDSSVLAYSSEKNVNTEIAKYLFRIKDFSSSDEDVAFSAKVSLKSNSGDIMIGTIQKCSHLWSTERHIKAPNCYENGYEYFSCIICGSENKIANTETSKLEHVPSDWIVDKQATQQEIGKKHKKCTVCHTVLETETIPTLPIEDPPPTVDPSDIPGGGSSESNGSAEPEDVCEESETPVILIISIIVGSVLAAFVSAIIIVKLIRRRKKKKQNISEI